MRVFATFLKKGSAKNFLAERFLGVFKNSALNLYQFYAVGVFSFKFDVAMPEFKSFLFRFFQKTNGAWGNAP